MTWNVWAEAGVARFRGPTELPGGWGDGRSDHIRFGAWGEGAERGEFLFLQKGKEPWTLPREHVVRVVTQDEFGPTFHELQEYPHDT